MSAVLAAALRKTGPEWALILSLAVIAVVGVLLSRTLGEIIDLLRELMNAANLTPNLFSPVIKVAGIAIISRIGNEFCKDAGEGALAAIVEITGALGAVLVSLPLFRAVWDMLQAMI